MTLALLLGSVMTRALLTLVYYAVVTPIGLAALGMRRRFFGEAGRQTYWIDRAAVTEKKRYEKQF